MADNSNQIGILFGVEGGADVNGASGAKIAKQLQDIADKLDGKIKFVASLDKTKTRKAILDQLKDIQSDIKLGLPEIDKKSSDKAINSFRALSKKLGSAMADLTGLKGNTFRNKNAFLLDSELKSFQGNSKELLAQIQKFQSDYKQVVAGIDKLQIGGTFNITKDNFKEANDLYQKFEDLKIEAHQLKAINTEIKTTETANLQPLKVLDSVTKYLQKYQTTLAKNAPTQYKQLLELSTQLRNGAYIGKGGQAQQNFLQIATNARLAGGEVETLAQQIKRVFNEKLGYGVMATVALYARQVFIDLYNNVVKIDTAMTELKKVTDETNETYKRFLDNASDRAQKLGASMSDIISASADFARLGFNIDEASDLADAAIVYKNVGDGISDVNTASESIISTLKAFNIAADDVMKIVDIYNAIGNTEATSSAGIGESLQRSASALSVAGASIEEAAALAAAMNTTVQNSEKVGTTLKTASMYLRAAKTDAEDAGESTEGMADSVSQLRDELKSITGVDIMKDDNTFKGIFQQYRELAEVWNGNKLTDVAKANVLNLLGGKRNADAISGMLNNWEVAERALQTAQNSSGSALAENEKYLDSINGKIEKLKGLWENISVNSLDSSTVKILLDISNILMTIVDGMAKTGLLLPTIVGAIVTIKNIGAARSAVSDISTVISGYTAEKLTIDQLAFSVAELDAKYQKIAISKLAAMGVDKAALQSKLQEIIQNKELSASMVELDLLSAQLSNSDIKEIMSTQALITAKETESIVDKAALLTQAQELHQKGLLSKAGYERVVSLTAETTATGAATSANLGFASSFKALFASMGPIGWISLAVSVLIPIISAIAGNIKSASERFEEAAEEAKNLQDEITSINEEITKTNEKITELQSKGSLTIVEQNQLKTLKKTNAELENQVKLKKAALKDKTAEARETFQKTMDEKGISPNNEYDSIVTYWAKEVDRLKAKRTNIVDDVLETQIQTAEANLAYYQDLRIQNAQSGNTIDSKIAALRKTQSELRSADSNSDFEHIRDKYEKDRKALYDEIYGKDGLQTQVDTLLKAGYEYGSDKATDAYLDRIQEIIDTYQVATGEYETLWNAIVSRPRFKEASDELDKLASSGKLTAETLANAFKNGGNTEIQNLIGYLSELGMIDWEETFGKKDFQKYDENVDGVLSASELMKVGAENLVPALKSVANEFAKINDASSTFAKISFEDMYKGIKTATTAITSAQKDMEDSNYLSAESISDLKAAGLDEYIIQTADGYKLAKGALDSYLESQGKTYQEAVNKAVASAKKLASSHKGYNDELAKTPENLLKILKAQQAAYSAKAVSDDKNLQKQISKIRSSTSMTSGEKGTRISALEAQWYVENKPIFDLYDDAISDLESAISNNNQYKSIVGTVKRDSANSVSKSSSSTDKNLETYKLKLSDLETLYKNDEISASTYYKRYDKLVKKYLSNTKKNRKKYQKEINEANQEIYKGKKQLRIDNYDGGAEKYKNQYERGTISAKIYYQNLAKLQKKWLANSKKNQKLYAKEIQESQKEIYEGLKELYKQDLEAKKDNIQKKIDSLEKERDAYEDTIDKELDALDKRRDKEDQDKNDKELQDELLAIQAKIRYLTLDSSAAGQKALLEARQQEKEIQENIEENNSDKAYEESKETIEDRKESYLKSIDRKIEKYNKQIDNIETSIDNISDNASGLRKTIEKWAKAKGIKVSGAFASGTSNAPGGYALTQERGVETIAQATGRGTYLFLQPGSKVWNAQATDFLYRFANSPKNLLRTFGKDFTAGYNLVENKPVNITVGDTIIQGDADQKTVAQIKRGQDDLVRKILEALKKIK